MKRDIPMPTENRSSNTEMVSFPRELSDDLAELIATRARVCGGGALEIWDAICDSFGKSLEGHKDVAIQALNSTIESRVELSGVLDLLRRIRSARDWNGSHVGLKKEIDAALSRATQAPQPHPEPIAWMVGTAIWWTKEEAERDAAATGKTITPFGPLTGSADIEQLREAIKHSDAQIMRQSMRISNQRAQLAERDALLQRALPYLSNTPDLVQQGAEDLAEEIRSASAGKPCYGPNEWGTECGKCSKCKPASAEPKVKS